MRRVPSWLLVAGLVLCGCGAGAPPAPPAPPNLVLVIGDDQGYADFGFMGSPVIQTPRLDRLAEEGVVFPVGYSTASVCSPALHTLLTGLQPFQYALLEQDWQKQAMRHRLEQAGHHRQERRLVASLETLPRLLAQRGYTSFQAGKLWENYRTAGFDEGMSVRPGLPGMAEARPLVRKTMEPVFSFLERNTGHPFLLWFAPLLPHLPFDAPKRYRALYPHIKPPRKLYYANISWFDDAVGQLVDRVRDLGLEKRTLFVYVVDNGWDARGPVGMIGGAKGKLSLYELGLRTPVVLRWKGVIQPARRQELVSLIDVVPTLLDYAGARVPPDLAGLSLRPLVEGSGGWPRQQLIGWMPDLRAEKGVRHSASVAGGGYFWRDARWHYLEPVGGAPELYDLDADPQESHDVISAHPELAARAHEQIQEWALRMSKSTHPSAEPRVAAHSM